MLWILEKFFFIYLIIDKYQSKEILELIKIIKDIELKYSEDEFEIKIISKYYSNILTNKIFFSFSAVFFSKWNRTMKIAP